MVDMLFFFWMMGCVIIGLLAASAFLLSDIRDKLQEVNKKLDNNEK